MMCYALLMFDRRNSQHYNAKNLTAKAQRTARKASPAKIFFTFPLRLCAFAVEGLAILSLYAA